jgi:hypothetical protein
MPDELDPATLERVLSQILEDAAFLFTEPAPPGSPCPVPLYEATLAFTAPRPGKLTLRAGPELGAEAAANLLGLDASEDEAKQNAGPALGELLNMVAGLLMKEWFGTQAHCSLGLPVVVRHATAPPALCGAMQARLMVGEQRLDVAADLLGA